MKPKFGAYLLSLIFAMIATLLFVLIPFSENLLVAYIFCLLSILLIAVGFFLADKKNVAASYALIGKNWRYLPWTLVISAIVLVLEWLSLVTVPYLIHGAAQVILMAILSIKVVQIIGGTTYIKQVEDKVVEKRSAWVEMTQRANMLAAREENAQAKAALTKVAEALRYSDPMGSAASLAIENHIEILLGNATGEDCTEKCDELLQLIEERNAIAKANK